MHTQLDGALLRCVTYARTKYARVPGRFFARWTTDPAPVYPRERCGALRVHLRD